MPLNINTREVGLERSIEQTVNKVNRRGMSVKLKASDYTQPLGRITQKADEFNKSLEASNARVIAFGASAAIIGGVTQTFVQLVTQATKVEKILTDINVVLGTSAENLEKFGQDLFSVARNTSQGLETAAEAALEFSRQGLSMEETLSRTNDALILTRLTGIGAAEAVSGLTAAVNGFADAGLTTTEIINKLAAVDVAFAVSAEDLINALARAGAVAQDAGVNFDQLVGAVTSAQQITARGGAVIGNSFKTIFTRVQRSSTLNSLEELGVVVRDLRGDTLPAIQVLTNLASAYDTLGDTTKAAVAEQVGGVFQINILKAALKDLTRENSLYAKATGISASATNEAQQKNEQLQQTVQSLAAQTSLSIQELASNLGELSLAPGISQILDAFKGLSEGLNSLLGDDSEGIGADFAKGFVKGIGGVITGPGVILAIGVFAKLFTSALKFGRDSLKDILQITTAKDKEKKIQESILQVLQTNQSVAEKLKSLSNDKASQEKVILTAIKAQTAELENQKRIAQSIAPGLRRKGVEPDLTIKNKSASTAAAGFIPNFSSVTPMERQKERGGAMKAGYSPGAVKDMSIKGVGRVIYNNKETVKKFPGMSQPAIMPPSSSKAGNNYKNNFQKQHGFDPYSSSGFIPNFIDRSKIVNLSERGATQGERDAAANKLKDFDAKNPTKNFTLNNESERRFVEIYLQNKTGSGALYLDRLKKINGYSDSQLKDLQALRQHYQQKGSGSVSLNGSSMNSDGFVPNFADSKNAYIVPGTNILELPQTKMQVETNVADYKGNKKTGLHKMEAPVRTIAGKMTSYRKELSVLEDQAGVNLLSRNILFSSHDNPTGKKEIKSSAQGLTDKFSRGTKGKKKPTTKAVGGKYEDELHSQKLKSLGYVKTPDQSKVDFIGKGLKPLEAKFNKIEQSNLIAKSIRLYSDKSIPNFLRSKGLIDESQSINKKNFKDSLLTLKQSGINTDSMSLKEQAKTLKEYNLSKGFIPNFAFSSRVEKAKVLREAFKDTARFNTLKDLSKSLNIPYPTFQRRVQEHKTKPQQYIDDLGFLKLYDSNKTVKKIVDTNNLRNKKDLINYTNSNQIDNKLSMAYEKDIDSHGAREVNFINNRADKIIQKAKSQGSTPSRVSPEDVFNIAEDLKNKKFTSIKGIAAKYPVDKQFLQNTIYSSSSRVSRFSKILGQRKYAQYKNDLSPLLNLQTRNPLDKYKPNIINLNEGLKKQEYTNINNALSKTGLPKSYLMHSTSPQTAYGKLTKDTLSESYGSLQEYKAFSHNVNNLRRSSLGDLSDSEVKLMHDNLNKNKYNSYKAFLTQHKLTTSKAKGLLSTDTSRGAFVHTALGGDQEYNRFTSNLQKLSEKSKSKKQAKQFIKGNAFEEYIVEQAFGTPYTANPDPFDLKNIKGKLTNQLQSLFNIGDGKKYNYGDTIWSQESIGHGDAKMLKKILNERLINLNKFQPAQLKENENQKIKSGKSQALKPKQQPQSKQNTATENFNFRLSNKAADMIGTPSGRGGSETRSAIVTENNNKLRGQKGASAYIKPAIGKAIPDGSKIKFTYTKDYISAPPEAIQALEEIKDGQKRPNIAARMAEIKKENNSSLGFIPNFQIAAGKLADVAGQENKMGGDVANGFVPNFANPLQQAISRERAAGVPKSMIRVDQDRSLQSKNNPQGLAVINTRDEPAGVKQGISRAKKMGVDPKSHGASVGLIPNFAEYENDVSTALDLGAVSEGLIPNYAFKNFGSKIKKPIQSLGNKIGNFFNTSEKQFLKIWQTTNDKVKYLTDLGMDQISAIQTSKMAPRSVYKTIKREADSLEKAQINRNVNNYIDRIERGERSPFYSDDPEVQSIARQVASREYSNGLIPNFANLTLYRGQSKSRSTIDKPTIDKNMPSFSGVNTPEDAVKIIQNFVKSHVSGPMSGYRDTGEIDNVMPSGATSFSTSETVAKNFAGSITPGLPVTEGQVLSKNVPEKNVFNKNKLLKILNKGADPKRKYYPKVEEFKKAMASGAIKKWAEQNGGIYLNVAGRRNDRSLLKHYKTEYGRKDYDFYEKSMNSMVPQSDIGRNPNGTNQISPREQEVMQVFNKGLIPKSKQNARHKNQIQISPNPSPFQPLELNKVSAFLARYNREKGGISLKTKLTGEPGLKITQRNQGDWRQFMNHALFGNLAKQSLAAASKTKYQIQQGPNGKETVRGFTQGVDLPNDDIRLPAAASLGLIPNFAYNKRPMAKFGTDYPDGTNGAAYTGKTLKNQKSFLTEKGFQEFKANMQQQKKSISGIKPGQFQGKNVYWLNTPKAQQEVQSWGSQPNAQKLASQQKRQKDNKAYSDEIKFGKFEPSSAISQQIHFNKYGYGASLSYDNIKENAVKKLGKQYEYVSYNEKNIADYAKQNKIYLPQKQGGLTSNTPSLDMTGAFKKIMNLPASEIQKLNVIKPREKTKSEISIDASNKEANQIRWVKPRTQDGKDWSLKANPSGLKKFREFLVENQVPQSSISKFDQAIAQRKQKTKTVRDQSSKTFKQFGNQRRKTNQAKSDMNYFKNDSNLISTKNLYIPNLKGLIKDYNQNYANIGFVPNFASKNFDQPGQQISSNTQLSDSSNSKNFSAPGSKPKHSSSSIDSSNSKNLFESGSVMPEPQTLDSGTVFSQSEIKKVLLEYDLDSLDQGIMELQAQNITVPTNIIREVYDRKEKQSAFSGQRKKINTLGSSDEALNQAVNREISAGVPKSQIRIEQDNSLRSSQNSKGLAVTNLKDEPGGIKQGIARSKNMGIDPKTHGASLGFVPNFIGQRGPSKGKPSGFAAYDSSNNQTTSSFQSFPSKTPSKTPSQSPDAQDNGKVKESNNEAAAASEGLSMRLMGLTTVTYALESAFADVEGTTGEVVRGFNGVVQGVSQATLAFDAMKGVGKSVNNWIGESKLGKAASATVAAGEGASLFSKKGAMGGVAKGFLALGSALPIAGAALGAIGPAMDLLKEHTKSAAEKMAKSLGDASAKADAFGASLSAAESLQDINNKLLDLSNSSQAGTYEGRLKEIQLLGQQAKQQVALTEQVKSLGDTAGVTEEDIILMTSGSAEGLQKLREASLSAQQSLSGLQQVKTWADSLKTESLFGLGLIGDDKKEDPIMKKLAETNMSRSFNRSAGGDATQALAQINKLQSLISQVNPNLSGDSNQGAGKSRGARISLPSNTPGEGQQNKRKTSASRGARISLPSNTSGEGQRSKRKRSRSFNYSGAVGNSFLATSKLYQERNDETRAMAKKQGIKLEKNMFGGVDYAKTRNQNPELSTSIVDAEINSKYAKVGTKGGNKSITEVSQAIADSDEFSDEIKGQAKGILEALEKGVDLKDITELFENLKDNVARYANETEEIANDADKLARIQANTLSLEREISNSYKTRMALSDSMNAHMHEMLKYSDSLSGAQQSYVSNLGGIDKVSGIMLKQARERAAQDRNVTQEERAIRRKAIDELKEKTTTLLQDKGTSLGKSFLKDPTAQGGGGVDTKKLTASLSNIGFTEKEVAGVQAQFKKLEGELDDPISAAGAMAVIMGTLNNRLSSLVDSGDLEGVKKITNALVGEGGGPEGSILNTTGQKSQGLVDDISNTVDTAKQDQANLDQKTAIEKEILTQTQALALLKAGEVKAVEKALLFLEQQTATIGQNAVSNQQATNRTQSYLLEKQKIETNALTSGEGLVSLIDGEVITRQAALDLEKRRNVGLLGLIDSEEKLQGIVAAEIANKLGSRASSIGMSAATDTQMKQTITSEDASSDPQLQQFVGQTGYEAMAGMQTQELTGQMSVLSSQYAANAAAGVYQQEALNEMTKSTIDFKIAMEKVQTKLNKGGFALEGVQDIKLQRKQTEGRKQSVTAQQGFYEGSGNTVKAAEKQVELAKITQEQNIELYGKEALFRDTLNVRIAENNLAIEKFSQTLANTSFDAVQSGFKNMVKDMGNAAMKMEDVFMKFAGSIVQKIHDQLIDRASMQLTSGIFSAMGFGSDSSTGGGLTGTKKNLGGIIHRNKGGGVGYADNKKVPTMLTSGEYVVRKKIVDRLGQDKLEKMNSNGSLEDIYKMNTGGPVTLSSSGGAPTPIVKLNSGGLATALKRAMGGLVFANAGGYMKEKWNQAKSWTNDNILNPSSNSASMNIARGGGYLAGSMYGAYENREEEEYGGPTAPEDPGKRKLNLSSSLNIDPSGNQMSARFRANNDYSKKYGDYLLNKYDYDVEQQNAKTKAKHAKYSGMVGGIGAGLAMGEIGKFAKTAKAAYDMRGGVGANIKGMFTEDPAQKAALRKQGAQTDLANFKEKGITDYTSWKDKSSGSFDFMSKGYSESSAGKAFKEKHGFEYSGNSFIQSENYQQSKALATSKSIQANLLKASESISKNQGPARGSSTLDSSSSSKGSYMPFVNNSVPSPATPSGSEQQSMAMSKSIQKSLTKSDLILSNISKSQNFGPATSKAPSISFGGGMTPSIDSRFGDRYGSSFNSGMNIDDFSDGSCSNGVCAMPQGFSQGGKVVGRGGIDKIGPIMLDQGEYVVKADSVSKIEKNNPGFFDRLNSMNMMNQGGVVTSPSSPTPDSPKSPGGGGGAAGNVTVNITVNSSGDTTSSGGGDGEQAMAGKIKDAVVGVISQEKQTGGSLSGY